MSMRLGHWWRENLVIQFVKDVNMKEASSYYEVTNRYSNLPLFYCVIHGMSVQHRFTALGVKTGQDMCIWCSSSQHLEGYMMFIWVIFQDTLFSWVGQISYQPKMYPFPHSSPILPVPFLLSSFSHPTSIPHPPLLSGDTTFLVNLLPQTMCMTMRADFPIYTHFVCHTHVMPLNTHMLFNRHSNSLSLLTQSVWYNVHHSKEFSWVDFQCCKVNTAKWQHTIY